MLRKKLFVFYHHGPGNEAIARKDYDEFYEKIIPKIDSNRDLDIDAAFCPDVIALLKKLEALTDPDAKLDELYLHFSGHGSVAGIPYKDWILANDNFAALLRHPKIKFCFFSSCQSGELAKLASAAKIPVVIGTAGENDIENNFAIHFQNEFYSKLLESFTYKDAYEYAVAHANQQFARNNGLNIILRGEGGGDISDETEINELQLILTSKAGEIQYLIPPNWVMKMNEAGYEKTWCLNWFDDKTLRDKFYQGLEGEGLGEVLSWEELPIHELYLLKDRGTDDPFKNGEVNIVLHCSKEDLLPEDLRLYLQDSKTLAAKNLKVVFCFRQNLNTGKLLGDVVLLGHYPESQIFKFQNYSADLIPADPFRKALDRNEISATERKKMVMDFNPEPIKSQFLSISDENKFIRIFFAQNANERLINFIAKWAKSTSLPNSPPFISDNLHNAQLDLLADLENQLRLHFNNSKPLGLQLIGLLDSGAIIILRNRSNVPDSSMAIVQGLLEKLNSAAQNFENYIPSQPTIVFVLHNGIFQEPDAMDRRIGVKRFAKPDNVNKGMIDKWAENYSPIKSTPKEVVKKVEFIAGKFNEDDYREKCPSLVLEFFCRELKLPQAAVFKI